MSVDFEEEARITETVARPRSGASGRLVPILLGSAALCVLAYAAYVSFGKAPSQGAGKEHEEFKTASRSAHLHFDPGEPVEPPDNKLVINRAWGDPQSRLNGLYQLTKGLSAIVRKAAKKEAVAA